MKVIDVYPPNTPGPPRPLCQAKLTRYVTERNAYWRAKGTFTTGSKQWRREIPDDQCGNHARYKINGAWHCRKHGALVALDLVAEKVK